MYGTNTETRNSNPLDIPETYKIWPFELSDFQKDAVSSIYNNNDTLVCAPTGSGKTLPAEFAIHLFHERDRKVIYTTPVKALSNEKFNDLSKKFPNISFGLLTGDNKFNPEADVVVMTTEILLNTLNKMSSLTLKQGKIKEALKETLDFDIDLTRLGAVIFDEIHYINDPDRGPVWEKSIMKLPKNTIYVGLSATIYGPEKLCKWSQTPLPLGAGRGKMTLCETHHRNVPLEHYSFMSIPESNFKKMNTETTSMISEFVNKPILLKQQDHPFQEKTYDQIKKVLKYVCDKRIVIKPSFIFNKMVEYLYNNSILPAIAFVFSRKQCYIWANIVNKTLFEEGSLIPSIIEKKATQILISKLPNWKEYVELPEFKSIVKLLEKGIAVHHSGVTPVFREMIELLFKEGLIRLLVATETFAIGINMGIKCCIFTSLTKFDGRQFRFLHSHEYGQAAGRAGRRGKDKKGVIFHLNMLYNARDNNPGADVYRRMLSGNPQTLVSKFKVDFNLILSMLNVGTTNLSDFVNSSMLTNEMNGELVEVKKQLEKLKETYIRVENGLQYLQTPKDVMEHYFDLKTEESITTNKKKKKKIKNLVVFEEQEYKHLLKDVEQYKKLDNIKELIQNKEKTIHNITSYVDSEIEIHLKILKENGFIEIKDDISVLTLKGEIAANIHEVHSLAIADILVDGKLDKLNIEEIVAVLSVFQDVKLSDDVKYHNYNGCNVNKTIKQGIRDIKKSLDHYYDIETHYQTNFSQSYGIQYDTCEFMYNWCFTENNVDCRNIYEEAKKYNIYTGEFVKAILKLVNISNELEKVCYITENVELMNKLSHVKDRVLKSIATNQSLYL